jgi:tetratricopeptide (TPR) repeat protein
MQPARKPVSHKPPVPKVVAELQAAAKLAIQCHKAGDVATAEKLYGHVLLVDPGQPLCLHNLGTIRLKRNDMQAALDLLEAAVRADARRPLFHCTLGTARLQAGDAQGALASFQAAIDLQANDSAGWDGLGLALRRLDRIDEAVAALRRAVKLDPSSRAASRNLGNALIDVGQLEEAELIYSQLLENNPLDPEAAIQRGIIRLTRADFRGWDEYAWSHWSQDWLKIDPPVLVPLPQWEGEALQQQGLMLYGEQGIGDEIMFASFAQVAATRAARTVLLCEPRLVPLFARSFPAIAVASKPRSGEPPLLGPDTNCQVRCSLSRLPGVLGIRREDFTGATFLHADPDAVRSWQSRLAALGDGLKVGISWRGGNTDAARARRSLTLDSFAPLFAVPGVRFVNVQYGNHAEEIAAFNQKVEQPLHSFTDVDPMRDMDGLAALLCALDLVISVDNSTVHLAGALGVKTWMLCPFSANWRWTQQGEETFWYDSVRLYRQDAPGSTLWSPVIDRMALSLRDAVATPPPRAALPAATPTQTPSAALAPAATVMLLNDAAYWYDWGSTGTSLAVHEYLRAAGHVVDSVPVAIVNHVAPLPASASELDDDDLFRRFSDRNAALLERMQAVTDIVLNVAGTIRGLGQVARARLYLAWIAKRRLGKRVSIINHSCCPSTKPEGEADADALYARVYQAMDFVAVREAHSAAQLARLGVTAAESFDCLPLFIDSHRPNPMPARERRVVFCGSNAQDPALIDLLDGVAAHALKNGFAIEVLVGGSAFLAPEDLHLVAALHPRLRGRYRLVAATSERQWLQCIAGAQLLLSGRLHHTVAAAFLGTPLMIVDGNTPEMHGLIERLRLDRDAIQAFTSDKPCAVSRAAALLQNPQPGLVCAERLAQLRELSQNNFAFR